MQTLSGRLDATYLKGLQHEMWSWRLYYLERINITLLGDNEIEALVRDPEFCVIKALMKRVTFELTSNRIDALISHNQIEVPLLLVDYIAKHKLIDCLSGEQIDKLVFSSKKEIAARTASELSEFLDTEKLKVLITKVQPRFSGMYEAALLGRYADEATKAAQDDYLSVKRTRCAL